jgi:hypothetical protein
MNTMTPESRPPHDRVSTRRQRYGFFSREWVPTILCFPLAMLGAAGLWFAAGLPYVCYPLALDRWPEMQECFSRYNIPPILIVLAVFCGLCSVAFLIASFAGLLFRRAWALWLVRKSLVLGYLVVLFYFYAVMNVTGQVARAVTEVANAPADGFLVDLFFWRWHWLWPAGCVTFLMAALHVLSWRRVAVNLYSGTDSEQPAPGDQIVENIRTHGRDPGFRKSVLSSSLAHLMVIIIIPVILSRFGCVRPYRVPLGSGSPAVAMMKVVQPKKKKKKRQKYILSVNSPIIFDIPDLDDSELIKEVEEETSLTYVADVTAVHGAMGTGGGNKPGWADGFADGEVRFIRLEYNGSHWDDGMDPASQAGVNFLKEFQRLAGGIKVARESESHPISHLRKYPKGQAPPFVYMTGSGGIHVSSSDIKILREYLRGGGMLLADCGSHQWHRSFQNFATALFPGNRLHEISEDDPIFQIPFTFPHGAPPLWHHGGSKAKGIKYKGRWTVFYFPGDLNDAWKTGHSGLDPALAESAFHLGTNIVYYSFTHYLQETRKYRK